MDAPAPDAAPTPEEEASLPPGVPPAASTWQIAPSAGPSRWSATRTETRRRTFWLIVLAVVIAPVLLVAGVLVFAGREVGAISSFPNETAGQITRVNVSTVGGRTQWELVAAPGLDRADGARLACDVVRPVFVKHGILDAEFYVVNRAGDVIGSWQTVCGAPKPEVPAA